MGLVYYNSPLFEKKVVSFDLAISDGMTNLWEEQINGWQLQFSGTRWPELLGEGSRKFNVFSDFNRALIWTLEPLYRGQKVRSSLLFIELVDFNGPTWLEIS